MWLKIQAKPFENHLKGIDVLNKIFVNYKFFSLIAVGDLILIDVVDFINIYKIRVCSIVHAEQNIWSP